MIKIYLTISSFVIILILLLGVVLPFLISYKDDLLVSIGILITLTVPIIIYIGSKIVINQFKNLKSNEEVSKS